MAGLQVGSWPYLQNFRKGMRQQRGRAARELAEAQEAAEAVPLQEAQRRLEWVDKKQKDLDERGLMVLGKPCYVGGERQGRGGPGASRQRAVAAL